MKNFHTFYLIIALFLGLVVIPGQTAAQDDCNLSGYITFTQGGWGSPSNSNPGKIRDTYFSSAFPNGLLIGTKYTLKLTSAGAVMNFLPQGGTASAFTQNYINPTDKLNILAGQMVAMTLSMEINKTGHFGPVTPKLEELVITSGSFKGMTVKELWTLINKALGGETVPYTLSQLNDAATSFNENFDNGTVNRKFLSCPAAKASLGDLVWFDTNHNGIQDSGEKGVADVTVELHDCSTGNLLATTKTNSNGIYSFTNLNPGSYYVKVIAPQNYVISPANQGTDDAADSDINQAGQTSCVTLTAGENNITLDAGIYTVENVDLSIEKSSSKTNPVLGEEFNYTIKVKNNGPGNASNVSASDPLPNGITFVSYSATQGSYNNTTGLWTVGSLANGASATLTITVKINYSQVNNSTVDLGPAKGFNLFVLEDLTQPSSDTEGKVAVGGDAYLSGYSVGDKLNGFSGDVLIVDHKLTYVSGSVYNGNVVYGSSTNLPQLSVSIVDGILDQGHPINFAGAKSYLLGLSSSLSNYTSNGSASIEYGGITLNGSDPYLNVFSVKGSDLSAANNVEINAPNGSVVVVNINGSEVKWSGGLTINGTTNAFTLFNFFEASKLKISGIDVRGTILAPQADLDFPAGLISGQAIVKSMTGTGQFNNILFLGNIPVVPKITNIATIISGAYNDAVPGNNTSSAQVTAVFTKDNGSTGNNGNNTGSENWQNVYSFGNGEIIYTMLYNGSDVYAGTWGGHIHKSTDGGKTWTAFSQGLKSSYVWSLLFHNGVLYASTEKGVFSFNGTEWKSAALDGKDVHALISHNGVLYAGTWGKGVFKSADNGKTWTEIGKDVFAAIGIQSLYFDNSGKLYVGTASIGIYRTEDFGITFTKMNMPYDCIWSVGGSAGYLYAGTYGGGIYRSADGIAWTKLSSSPSDYIYSVAVDGLGRLYASSWTNGVFTSSDNGNTWVPLGLGGMGVTSVAVNPSTPVVIAGTKNGEVFFTVNKVSGVENKSGMPADYSLGQNYPNPFNPATSIEFSVPVSGSYTLKVYDVNGRETAVLVSGHMNAGSYKATFNSNGLASGVYLYRLSGENVNLTKKMVLMK